MADMIRYRKIYDRVKALLYLWYDTTKIHHFIVRAYSEYNDEDDSQAGELMAYDLNGNVILFDFTKPWFTTHKPRAREIDHYSENNGEVAELLSIYDELQAELAIALGIDLSKHSDEDALTIYHHEFDFVQPPEMPILFIQEG